MDVFDMDSLDSGQVLGYLMDFQSPLSIVTPNLLLF
jgi:hypothetical protein